MFIDEAEAFEQVAPEIQLEEIGKGLTEVQVNRGQSIAFKPQLREIFEEKRVLEGNFLDRIVAQVKELQTWEVLKGRQTLELIRVQIKLLDRTFLRERSRRDLVVRSLQNFEFLGEKMELQILQEIKVDSELFGDETLKSESPQRSNLSPRVIEHE